MATTHTELTAEARRALPKGERLLCDMSEAHDQAYGQARRLQIWATSCWWVSVICAGVASISGFLAKVPQIEHLIRIQPWMISAAASLGAIIHVVQQMVGWRAKSIEYRRHHNALRSLILQAEFETAANDEQAIAELSQAFRQERERLGQHLHAIDSPGDDPNANSARKS